jgi:plasmid stability protein
MSKMIQVRNVPDRLHRELTKRAKARGQALTDYIQDLLEREVARPPAADVFDRIEKRSPVQLRERPADLIGEERAAREAS